jgi:myo-inositol-1(or 4)-monophosphatase
MEIDDAHQVAVEAAKAAGALIMQGADGRVLVHAKGTFSDVVTSLEPTAERCIVQTIQREFPTHWIMSEEAGVLQGTDRRYVWVVDPLDGSHNVAIGLHTYVVGIALCRDGLPVLGVVHDPVAGGTCTAIRDRGTFHPTETPDRGSCGPLVAWTQGHKVPRDDPAAGALRLVLSSQAQRLLQLWAPLVSWEMLSRGAIDGFVGYCAEPWEMPAGTLLAREADVLIRELDGSEFDEHVLIDGLFGPRLRGPRSFVAGRPEVIDSLLDWVRRAADVQPDFARLLRSGG